MPANDFKPLPRVGTVGPGFGNLKTVGPTITALEDIPQTVVVDLLTDEEGELIRLLGGDRQLARRAMRLRGQYPLASFPELITYDWLQQRNLSFTFQAKLFGGRAVRGGVVPDFLLNYGGQGMIWRIQGEYWHTRPGNRNKDLNEKIRLLGSEQNGLRIEHVIDIWEDDVYNKRPQVFHLALAGIGLRG